MNLQYVKEVLGVKHIIRPQKWEEIYTLYGPLDQEYLLLSEEEYSPEQRQLVTRIMNSIHQRNYTFIHIKQFQPVLLKNLMFRSSAKKFIAFGRLWQNYLPQSQSGQNRQNENKIPFHQVFEYALSVNIQLKGLVTYCLSGFLSPQSRQKKLTAFSQMKLISKA